MRVQLLVTVEECDNLEHEDEPLVQAILEDIAIKNVLDALLDHPHIRRVIEVRPMWHVALVSEE